MISLHKLLVQRSKFKNFTSIHERPIFWSLATNLGTTFKAPKNLGARVTSITPVTLDDIASYFFIEYSSYFRWYCLIQFNSIASIHERPIFRSLATNLGTTFKALKNLGAIGEDSQWCSSTGANRAAASGRAGSCGRTGGCERPTWLGYRCGMTSQQVSPRTGVDARGAPESINRCCLYSFLSLVLVLTPKSCDLLVPR